MRKLELRCGRWPLVAGLCLALVIAACGVKDTGSPAICPAPPAACDTASQNGWLYSLMKDLYFWSGAVPTLDPATYASPDALLAATIYQPLDRWSYITTLDSYMSFFGDGQYLGYGFGEKKGADGLWRVSVVYPESAAGRAGLRRGYIINSLDGIPMAQVEAQDLWSQVFKGATAGVTMNIGYTATDGSTGSADMVKGVVTIPPVIKSGMLNKGGKRVAYLNFSAFFGKTSAALGEAFDGFHAAGAQALVLDLRYNGGGYVDTANRLANLAAGADADGKVFVRLRHNAGHATLDKMLRIIRRSLSAVPSMPVAVIATSATASASELVINGLKPYMDVSVVGATTHGKPVGMYGCYFCGNVVSPVSFESVNGNGVGGYYGGIAAECAAMDDLTRDFGDPEESSLREALYRVTHGRCSAGAGQGKPSLSPGRGFPLEGIQREAGAR